MVTVHAPTVKGSLSWLTNAPITPRAHRFHGGTLVLLLADFGDAEHDQLWAPGLYQVLTT